MWLKSYLETTSHPWQQESWVASNCMCCKLDLETTSTLHGQQKIWVASICMWCKSNLKSTSDLKGSANFDNSWKKKSRFEKKVKYLKGIDQSSKG